MMTIEHRLHATCRRAPSGVGTDADVEVPAGVGVDAPVGVGVDAPVGAGVDAPADTIPERMP